MHSTTVDFVVVGQGIAGSVLAWHLHFLGKHVVIIDREESVTSSKVAAGLISPISGKRAAVSWRFAELWSYAQSFYQRVERLTDCQFFSQMEIVRFFPSERAPLHLGSRVGGYLTNPSQTTSPAYPWSAALKPSGRVDVPAFLAATRKYFRGKQQYLRADVRGDDIERRDDGRLGLPIDDLATTCLLFCEGAAGRWNRLLPELSFEPAKGEILRVHIADLSQERVLHFGRWLAPVGDNEFLLGATFDRDSLSEGPTKLGREALLEDAQRFLGYEPPVIQQTSALRPILRGRLPQVGIHPHDHRIGFFNGLGAKGSLRAPWVAAQFAAHLVRGTHLEAEIHYAPARKRIVAPRRLTSLAHEHVSRAAGRGDLVIDATAGNGLDTEFLSALVGDTGRVLAVDIQPAAIQRVAARMRDTNAENVRLICGDHADLTHLVDAEWHGQIAAIMFNLGYLPRGRKEVTTLPATSQAAIRQSAEMLKSGGIISILAYTGHPGGLEEARVVEQTLMSFTGDYEVIVPDEPLVGGAPRLSIVRRH